jgi:peptidoglycan/xylan/chitin deacetylase (PgdA/CDA1 family)
MEYGSRVGIWRLCRLIDRYQIPVTFSACALAVERNPPLGEWLRARDHDVLAHGYHWYGPDAVGMNRDQERDEIRRAVDSLLRTTGQRARGWMVRSFPTVHTRELLVEHGGFVYDSDANNDELPYYADTLGTPFLVVPYSKVHNDVRYLIAPTYATPRHFFESLRLSLDYMLDEARHGYGGRLMSVGVHSRWSAMRTPTCRAPSVTPELCGDPSRLGSSKNGYLVLNPDPGPGSCHQASIPAQKSG